ncbi:MAG: hypothetical protein RL385_776 [Pseudomonadota bacterium]|jgi:hypothetical protein
MIMRTTPLALCALAILACGDTSFSPAAEAGPADARGGSGDGGADAASADAGGQPLDGSAPADAAAPDATAPKDAGDVSADVWLVGARGFELSVTGGFVAPANCGMPQWVYTCTAPAALKVQGCKPADVGAVDASVTLGAAQIAALTTQLGALHATTELEQVAEVGFATLRVMKSPVRGPGVRSAQAPCGPRRGTCAGHETACPRK